MDSSRLPTRGFACRGRSRKGTRTAARSSSSNTSPSAAGPTRPSASSGARSRGCTRTTASEFGWHRDNFIGLTAQSNARHASWAEFWQRERLAPQLALAARNGHGGELQSLGEQVIDAVPALLAGHAPAPSLLHGDLWSGNAAFLGDGTPVVFDPAVYFGDAEADLAMTELFGGFPRELLRGLPGGTADRRRATGGGTSSTTCTTCSTTSTCSAGGIARRRSG